MLKKLLKHDFHAVWRLALPIFAIMVAITLIIVLVCTIPFENQILALFPSVLFPVGIILLMFGCACVFILPILHFYRSLMTNEGYLSFTLPVEISQLVLSKLIVGAITMLLNVVLSVSCTLLLIFSKFDLSLNDILESLDIQVGGHLSSFLWMMIASILVSVVTQQLNFYLCICLGQVLCKNKIMGSALAYVMIYFVSQVITLAILFIMVLIVGLSNATTFLNTFDGVTTMLAVFTLEAVLLGIASYLISCRILKTKLNLN